MLKNEFAVIGGDYRSCYILYLLKLSNRKYVSAGIDSLLISDVNHNNCKIDKALQESENIILPLPISEDNIYINTPNSSKIITISDVINNLTADNFVFGGMFSDEIKSTLRKKSIKYYDYYDSEEIKLDNAVLTAEAALSIAINNTKKSIFGSKVLICGFGRIGKVLSRYLRDLGATVEVLHEKPYEKNQIKSERMIPLQLKNINNIDYSIIFNTVPEIIFDNKFISKINKNTLIIELASSPGGFDKNYARKIGCNVLEAYSLPGKTSPLSAAEIILTSITNHIKEEKSGG